MEGLNHGTFDMGEANKSNVHDSTLATLLLESADEAVMLRGYSLFGGLPENLKYEYMNSEAHQYLVEEYNNKRITMGDMLDLLEYEANYNLTCDVDSMKELLESALRFKTKEQNILMERVSDSSYIEEIKSLISNKKLNEVHDLFEECIIREVKIPSDLLKHAINNGLKVRKYLEYADSEIYLYELAIGIDKPITWSIKETWCIHITEDNISVTDREDHMRYMLIKGSYVLGVYIFAGKGSYTPLRIAPYLSRYYGGQPSEWFHARGRCSVNVNGKVKDGDLHWFQCLEIGAVGREIKEWYNMEPEELLIQHKPKSITTLTESGLLTEDGTLIKKGKMVSFLKSARRLFEENNMEGFMKLLSGEEFNDLTVDQQRLVLGADINHGRDTIIDIICHYEVNNAKRVEN